VQALVVIVLQSTFFDADLKRAPIRAGMTTPWMDLVASLVQKSEAKTLRRLDLAAEIYTSASRRRSRW
jgi:hypothetical protein